MKKFYSLLIGAIIMLAIPMGMMGQTRAEVLTYTLDGTITVTGNAYASPTELTQDGITWMVTGNTEQSPWRIGGKNISGVDRPVYSQTAISDNISKIEVTHGAASSITVNSWTVIVASDASFTNVVSTLTPAFAANATTTINRPTGADWSNCYYKFVYNVTVSATSNKYFQFSQAKFYKQEGTGPVIATPIFSPVGGEYATTQNVTISCETQGSTIYYTTDGSTPDNTCTQYTAAIPVSSTTTINAIAYVGTDASSVATATYSIVQPLATMQAIFDKATEVGTTATYVYITLDDWVVSGVSTNGKNVFVTDGTKGFVIFDNSANMGFNAGDVLSGTVYCKVQLYNGFAELTLLNATTSGLSITSGGTVTAANVTMANLSGINTGALVHYENLTCSVDNNKYYLSDGTTTLQVYNAIYAFGSTLVADHVYNITGVYQQYNTNNGETKEVLPRSASDIEEVVSAESSITVTPATIDAPAEGADGTLVITYENIPDLISFDYYFCDANGSELEGTDPDWIYAEINEPGEEEHYTISYIIDANQDDARTAYFKVYTFAGDEEVYAIVTVNQAEYVAPTYAELPFEFNGGKADIENTNGFYQEGLGNDYNGGSNVTTPLKFDGTGDWLLLQFNERPGTLTFDITGNSFSGGTFTVQTSEDGETYTDLEAYTELGATQTEEFELGENIRFIKWIYTTKASGNVGLGNITLTEYTEPAHAISVDPDSIVVGAEGGEGGFEYIPSWLDGGWAEDFEFYDAPNGETIDQPEWITIVLQIGEHEDYHYTIAANNGEARTAYFKAWTYDDDGETIVYSNLVTVSQAGAPQQYTLTVDPFENLELITFVNDEMVMEGDGEIQVTEGDHIMLSVVALDNYVMATLMVNGVNHVNDITDEFTYEFDMPGENITISATAVENVAPAGGNYVRITDLAQLTDGSKVIIAARYDEDHTNGYYAMPGQTSGKPVGVAFTSETSGNDEILPATITASENTYCWTVNVTNDGYTFTNADNQMIGYTSGTNFANDNNTEWTISIGTAAGSAMVGGYTGFVIKNKTTNTRAFAFNGSVFGAYATSNMTSSQAASYNFFLDFFVQTPETYTKTIIGYTSEQGNGSGNFYLIASPIGDVAPTNVTNMIKTDNNGKGYDLYRFNQNPVETEIDGVSTKLEWENYKQEGDHYHFNLESGKGYLYANSETVDLIFTGTAYSGTGEVSLTNNGDNDLSGWNLVGNPFTVKTYITGDYNVMNADGTEIIAATEDQDREENSVNPMEGIFVYTTEASTLQFSTTAPSKLSKRLALNLSRGRGVMDRAIVRFDDSQPMPKFQLKDNSTKVYIPMDGKDYAVVNAQEQGEMPVNFKAKENGTYTLSINTKDVNFGYLHLIDNMTGDDIDLNVTPSYTFNAKADDYESRFKLVYAADNTDDNDFAFISNGEIILNGQGTVQIYDVNGRMISSYNDVTSISTSDMANGVYMLRLINGNNVKTQKIVVK